MSARVSKKAPKDANAPKKPLSSYFMFTRDRRVALKAENPDMKVTELKVTQIAKELGKRWKALSDADKAPFVAKAAAAKKAFDAQLATYKQSADFAAHEQAIDDWKRGEKAGKAQAAGNAPKVTLPRKPKDANCPKRPQSAYFFFTASRRAELSAAHPDKKITEIAKLMGAEWKALSEDDRAPFAAQAAKAKAAYGPKMEAYAGSKLKLQEW